MAGFRLRSGPFVDTPIDPHRVAAIRLRHHFAHPALRQLRAAAVWMVHAPFRSSTIARIV